MPEDFKLIEQEFANLTKKLNECKGEYKYICSEKEKCEKYLTELNKNKELYTKAMELLNIVQTENRDQIKIAFESLISHFLHYVYKDDEWNFELDFDRHGNKPKMTFRLKSPNMQDAHEIRTTRAGGIKDIVALALRLVLLEVSHNKGFLWLDEPFKRLRDKDLVLNAMKFIQELQEKTNRQIFIIPLHNEIVDLVENPIILKKD